MGVDWMIKGYKELEAMTRCGRGLQEVDGGD